MNLFSSTLLRSPRSGLSRVYLGVSAILLLLGHFSQVRGEIPDRPEKLSFPPLTYEPPNPAEYRVALKSGPVAYIVPDRELPLVNLQILVRCGSYLEPDDKAGLANFTGYLLVRGGAGDKTAEQLEERLAFLAASLNAAVGADQGTVSLNLLSKDLAEGMRLLRDVLTQPRFQEDKFQLYRQQYIQNMQQRNDDSSSIEEREQSVLSFGSDFWANRFPTQKSIDAIRIEDLRAFHKKWFHPSNFVVAVNGDFDRSKMIEALEQFFADWPIRGEIPPAIPNRPALAKPGVYVVNKDVNQGRVSILMPGVTRDHPDFIPLQVMNDILGGGGFTSRIMNRVRSDEGLAYGAGSSVPGGIYYPRPIEASFQSKSRTVAYASSIILEEINRISANEVTAGELETAKRSFIDTFPENFNTTGRVAQTFARDEFTGRYAKHPDFWSKWRSRVDAVTAADVKRVAAQNLHPDQAVILIVGQRDEIAKGHPDHPIKLEQLASGKVSELPLRDPLTLEPLPTGKPSKSDSTSTD